MTYTVAKGNQLTDPDHVTPIAGAVDLRSDTVTLPSEEMRRAMAASEVGDDVYGEDPTVNKLQKRAAEIFGKEAALFVPTGCMPRAVHGGEDGILTWKQIETSIRPKIYYDSQTALVCLENSSNMAGGTV